MNAESASLRRLIIHDHFDGSAHCVECQGPCNLGPDDYAVTQLVRYVFECGATGSMGMRSALRDLGVPLETFSKRASGAS